MHIYALAQQSQGCVDPLSRKRRRALSGVGRTMHIFNTEISVKFIAKLLVFVLCAAGCGYQLVSVVMLYFEFRANIAVYVDTNKYLTLPGLTLCSTVGYVNLNDSFIIAL